MSTQIHALWHYSPIVITCITRYLKGGAIYLSTYSQLLKGILEGCILSFIEKEEIYGYELSVKLKEHGFTFVREGSIYPLLQRMQRDGLLEGVLRDSPNGPKRKYYFLTAEGKQNLAEFKKKLAASSKRCGTHTPRKEG